MQNPVSGLRILMYHAVGSPAHGDAVGLFSINPNLFKRHMMLLASWKFSQVVQFTGSALSGVGQRVAITFDDGYLDNLAVAAPILCELNLPFTVFVTSEFIRNEKKGFLSPHDLRELSSLPGAQIGAHGAKHVDLTQCDDRTMLEELVFSKQYLEDLLGKEVNTLAYPYGATNLRVRNAALISGYNIGACSLAGINRLGRDPLLLARTAILSLDNERVFLQKLRGNWDWYRRFSKDPVAS